jgi:hypothetical protein
LLALLAGTVLAYPPPDGPPPIPPPKPLAPPTAESIVRSFNENTTKAKALQATISIDVCQGKHQFGLDGDFAWQRGVGVRLVAKFLANPAMDVGEGPEGAWIWGRSAEQGRWRTHKGKGAWPAPVTPMWFAQVLGLEEQQTGDTHRLHVRGTELALGHPASAPDGKPVWHYFHFRSSLKALVVTEHRVEKPDGKVIVRAVLRDIKPEEKSGLSLPTRISLTWPEQNLTVDIRLRNVRVNPVFDETQVKHLFSPPPSPKVVEEAPVVFVRPGAVEVRRGEESLKLTGPLDEVSQRLLREQVKRWGADGKVLVRRDGAVHHATLVAVLDACREAGARQIEVRREE